MTVPLWLALHFAPFHYVYFYRDFVLLHQAKFSLAAKLVSFLSSFFYFVWGGVCICVVGFMSYLLYCIAQNLEHELSLSMPSIKGESKRTPQARAQSIYTLCSACLFCLHLLYNTKE